MVTRGFESRHLRLFVRLYQMNSSGSYCPSPTAIEQAIRSSTGQWQHIGRFHVAPMQDGSISLRRYDVVVLAVETNQGVELAKRDFFVQLGAFLARSEFHNLELCTILCTSAPTEWLDSEGIYPANTWVIEFPASFWEDVTRIALRLQQSVLRSIDLPSLNPFDWNSPCRDNMFFGRKDALDEILASPATSYAIVGPRRIGKTSLLKHLRKRLARFSGQTFIELDCSEIHSYDEFRIKLARRISPKASMMVAEAVYLPKARMMVAKAEHSLDYIIMNAASSLGARYVIALDEFDHIVKLGDPRFSELRAIIGSPRLHGRCRFIIAGYSALWDSLEDRNSYLYNLCRTITLGAFSHEEAHDFVRTTLGELGISVADSGAAIASLLMYSGRFPWLLQVLCSQIIQAYVRYGKVDPLDLVEYAAASDEIQESVLDSTIIDSSPLGQVLLSCVAKGKGRDELSISQCLSEYNVNVPVNLIMKELRALRVTNALVRTGRRYEISNGLLRNHIERFWALDDTIRFLKRDTAYQGFIAPDNGDARMTTPDRHIQIKLRAILTTRFNDSELRTLCFDLAVDYDSLPGQGLEDKARELIAHRERRGRIAELASRVRELRPDIAWDESAP